MQLTRLKLEDSPAAPYILPIQGFGDALPADEQSRTPWHQDSCTLFIVEINCMILKHQCKDYFDRKEAFLIRTTLVDDIFNWPGTDSWRYMTIKQGPLFVQHMLIKHLGFV